MSGHVLGWPEFDALALREIDVDALLRVLRPLRLRLDEEGARDRARPHPGRARAGPRPRRAAPASDVADAGAVGDDRQHYETVTTLEALDAWVARVEAAELAALDIETDSLDPIRARLIGLSLSVDARRGVLHPARRTAMPARPTSCRIDAGAGAPQALAGERAPPRRSATTSSTTRHVFAKRRHRRARLPARHDARELRLEAHKAHTLESLAFRHLGRTALTYEDVCGKGANQIPFAQVEIGARRRVRVRGRRHGAARAPGALAAARGRAGLADVYRRIEMPTSASSAASSAPAC